VDLPTTGSEPGGAQRDRPREDPAGIPQAWRDQIAEMTGTLREMGVDVRVDAEARLEALAGAIAKWNSVVNLVSRKDITRLITYHFGDSASLLPLLGPAGPVKALDIGGSNGLPGLVLAALSPHIDVTICDSRQKRRGFLEEVCGKAAAVPNLGAFEMARVDSQAFRVTHAQAFDLILARAVTRLNLLLKWCLPLLGPGGRLGAYKGSRSSEEMGEAEGYFFGHGGSRLWVVDSPLAQSCNALRLFVIAERGPASNPANSHETACG
jgi:16S rRNA (guanine527-N7)-methyltransferase